MCETGHRRPLAGVWLEAGAAAFSRTIVHGAQVRGLIEKDETMGWRGALFLMAAMGVCDASAGTLAAARYVAPVERYGHFALGRPHEYARVVAVLNDGRELSLELPDDEVFEDLAPRRVQLGAGEPTLLLAIVSQRGSGARLVLIGVEGGRLALVAQSAPIGTPKRWLNPVAVDDLDGDGRAEIAAVITPHIGGTLKIYRRDGPALVEVAAMPGFSNHAFGSAELALSRPMVIDGKPRLLVPDAQRVQLRVVAFESGQLFEVGRCRLSSPMVGAIEQVSAREVTVGLRNGRVPLMPGGCAK